MGVILFYYALYITSLSLFKAVHNDLQIRKDHGKRRVKTPMRGGYDSLLDVRVGWLLDGGGVPSRKKCQLMKDNPDRF